MDIPKRIEIKDANGVRTAYLSPSADGLKGCYPDCRLNGESILEFLLPANSPKIDKLTAECTIWTNDKVYNLLKDDAVDYVRDEENKLWAKFMAVERWNELDYEFPEPFITNDPFTPSPADLAVIIIGGGLDLSGGLYQVGTAAHALYAILDGSEWTLGTIDVTGIYDIEMEKASRLALIKQVQNIWGGFLVWDSVNKTVSLRDPNLWQNYTGFQARYKKNLKNITKTQSNRLITKLYAFGKDDLDIASVNSGYKYVEDHSYTQMEYIGIYKNPDVDDPQKLKDIALVELAVNCRPKYLYKIKITDLRTLQEYVHEDFSLGDMADIIDPDIAPDSPRPRIIRHRYNLFQPWDCEIEVGDPKERLEEMLKASFGITGYIDDTFTSNGQLTGYKIVNGSIESIKIKNLEANKITTDEAKITAAQIETLTVGGNVFMGPLATISWSQVSDAPSIPSLPGYIKSTYIDATTVKSPTIIGGTLKTGEEGYDRLELSGNGMVGYSADDARNGISIEVCQKEGFSSFFGNFFYDEGVLAGGLTLNMEDGRMWLYTESGYKIKISSAENMSLDAGNGYTLYIGATVGILNDVVCGGSWDFSSATVSGLDSVAKFG